jgi:ribosomal protein S11
MLLVVIGFNQPYTVPWRYNYIRNSFAHTIVAATERTGGQIAAQTMPSTGMLSVVD